MDEFPIPEGLKDRIMEATIGTSEAGLMKPTIGSRIKEWSRGFSFPISIPQLAPVAMMLIFAFFVFSQSASADGSIGGVYQKSFELAGKTYAQGANIVLGEKQSSNTKTP